MKFQCLARQPLSMQSATPQCLHLSEDRILLQAGVQAVPLEHKTVPQSSLCFNVGWLMDSLWMTGSPISILIVPKTISF